MTFKVSIITLTPDAWPGALGVSLIGNALKNEKWQLEIIDLRDFGKGKHKQIDDTAAGGGAGMVIKPDVALDAIKSINIDNRPIIYLTPRGKPIKQNRIREFAKTNGLVIFCGRFEGLDERAIKIAKMEEICISDVILMGGDIGAQLLTEAVVRLLDGIMGKEESHLNESFENGLLEYPLYTRPREIEGQEIPEILLGGNHAEINKWKMEKSIEITKEIRPDLWNEFISK